MTTHHESHNDDHATLANSDRQRRVLEALEELGAALDAGQSVDRTEILARYADVADELTGCLDGLDLVHDVAVQIDPLDQMTGTISTDPDEASSPKMLGDFRIVREIGRGGMGVVYEAEQQMLDRRVALKVLPFAALLDERQRIRFHNEARAAATLNHPNIVPVYSVGVERGVHYFAMQFIEGESLASLIETLQSDNPSRDSAVPASARPSSDTRGGLQAELSTVRSQQPREYFRSIARIGVQIAEGLQHAHERGILHRDIKPANLLIDAHGQAMIADFGLARLEGDAGVTLSGDVIGTLRYAPPEQVHGEAELVDRRADVYSLGATLYEALTLRPAVEGSSREQLLRQISEHQLTPPRKLDPRIPPELSMIVMKAMEQDPADRYRTAQALADDLNRFLDSRPILASRPSVASRAGKWARRHPKLILATATMLLLLSIGLLASLVTVRGAQRQAESQQSKAMENLQTALQAVDDMYRDVADKWVTQDTKLSPLQIEFMGRASTLYETIANQNRDEASLAYIVGKSYLRAGSMQLKRNQFEAAHDNFQAAIERLESQHRNDTADTEVGYELSQAYAELASLSLQRGELTESVSLYKRSVGHLNRIVDAEPWETQYVEALIANQQNVAVAMEGCGDTQAALRLTRELLPRIDLAIEQFPDYAPLCLKRLWSMGYLSQLLQDQQQFSEAVEVCRRGLAQIRHEDVIRWKDDRQVLQYMARVTAQMGHALKANEQFEESEAELRNALELQQRSFLYDGTPKQFLNRVVRNEAPMEQWESEAFVTYAEEQVELADILRQTDRIDEARQLLDDSTRTSFNLALIHPDVPRYTIAAAKAAGVTALMEPPEEERQLTSQLMLLEQIAKITCSLANDSPIPAAASECGLFLTRYASLLQRLGDQDQAREAIDQAVQYHHSALDRSPDNSLFQSRLQRSIKLQAELDALGWHVQNEVMGVATLSRCQICVTFVSNQRHGLPRPPRLLSHKQRPDIHLELTEQQPGDWH